MPRSPMSPMVLANSTGKMPCSHHSPTLGSTSFRTNSRTVSRSSRSSSSKSESMSRKSLGSGVASEMSAVMDATMLPVTLRPPLRGSAGESLLGQLAAVVGELLGEGLVADSQDRHSEEGGVGGGVDRHG